MISPDTFQMFVDIILVAGIIGLAVGLLIAFFGRR